jgi:hypothetical protein
MQIFMRSSSVNVFRDAIKSAGERLRDYNVVMARNEYQSYQICLRSDGEFTIKSVGFSDLIGDKQNIPSSNLSYNYVEYVYCPRNSLGRVTNLDEGIRMAPDWFPDPLSNNRSVHVPRKTTQPVWITIFIPTGTPAGIYKGIVTIQTTHGEFNTGLVVEVCAVTLPDTNKATLDYMHHQQITGAWWLEAKPGYYPHDPITICYGYNRFTQDWWALVDDIAKQMKARRQNILYVNIPQLLLDGGTEVDEKGVFTFNWSRLDEYIKFFMDRGVVKGLEGTHVAAIDYSIYHFTTYLLARDVDGRMKTTMVPYDSPDSENWLNQYLPALSAHIEEMGWMPIWYQNVADEAMNDAQLTQYTYYFKKVRELAPRLIVVSSPKLCINSFRHIVQEAA